MSFGISLNGHDVDLDKVKAVFETAVRDLRDAGAEDLNGSAWGGEGANTLSISVAQVDAAEAAVATEDDGSTTEPEA